MILFIVVRVHKIKRMLITSSFETVLRSIYKLRRNDFRRKFHEHISKRRTKLIFVDRKKETEEERFSRLISIFREIRGGSISNQA
jgi:hypothetical protein